MNSIINFLDSKEVLIKHSGKAKAVKRTIEVINIPKYAKYTEYGEILEPHIEDIRSKIDISSNGEAIISTRSLADLMCMDKKSDIAIYWGVKYIMWQYNITVSLRTHKNRSSSVLIFKNITKNEKLPDGLTRDKASNMKYRNKLVEKRGYKDLNEYNREMNYENGRRTPMNENKECSLYLGVYIAERILPLIFENVERMPQGYPGYDFICTKDKKVQVKSSSLGNNNNIWQFHINENKIVDYFFMVALDNRYDLNVTHIWLIKNNETIRGRELNDRVTLGITNNEKSLIKFKKYEITNKLDDIQKICDEFKKTG